MRIGTPKEIKNWETRVGLTPAGVHELVASGHEVYIETGAGLGIGFTDQAYRQAGAYISKDAETLFDVAELIVKVKEPLPIEIARLTPRHTLMTYLHLAADANQTSALMETNAICIAYETVTDTHGRLPLLTPMSEVAGRLSIQAGARYLERTEGGSGVLLGGVTGVARARVTIIGGGVAGVNAALMARGLGADVTILERSLDRLRELDTRFRGEVTTLFSTPATIADSVAASDLVIGAVLLPGAAAPKLITRSHIASMRAGSVVVDIAIDQGGCFETSRPTTHDDPVYSVDDIIHYCVSNMPAAVARTATEALANATLPYILELANLGVDHALRSNPYLADGLNIQRGELMHPAVITSFRDSLETATAH
jgi:alanine dehydrogenase